MLGSLKVTIPENIRDTKLCNNQLNYYIIASLKLSTQNTSTIY